MIRIEQADRKRMRRTIATVKLALKYLVSFMSGLVPKEI